jgi:Fanconi-associated nuclease 1
MEANEEIIVKSENDRLSDTQRMWIHVLTSAGVTVELCAAREKKESVTEEEVKAI